MNYCNFFLKCVKGKIRQLYVEFTSMCAGLLFTKRSGSRCLSGKTPVVKEVLVYNYTVMQLVPPVDNYLTQ